ncbi:GMC family oxidoreductase [Streptomyces phaeolivaceus]|uniref:GMC family oxidoreductase n=1 Tax=Streptomyces phaeolivaceus TaxID=2653200 RepID=A0A5P8KG82_9ACTN|nr:GMC family oxidoreductase [Streptomyces phaeolivaceus]QFR01638.1 GMC family oxidoreductase [Streptomyces phaeolivaceus]
MIPGVDAEPADVVVVGAGPSGAVVSTTLSAQGHRVVCLEQGDWMNPTDYPGNFPEWELLIQAQWSHDPNERSLASDYPVDVSESDLAPVMFNAVGGSSIYYGAHWHRLLPCDFRVRTLDGVADDWPITYEDLAPYYARVDALVGVSGVPGDPAYPDHDDYPLPPLPLGKVGRRAAEGANKLGWHWWPGSNAIPSNKFRLLSQCARWGVCEWGCPQSAKGSADVAWWPHALRSGATLITGARARRVESGRDGRATGVTWIDRAGREHFQAAKTVVLCGNGIGTPRLLLMSASSTHPDGLANSSGLVGRNLQLHPNCAVIGTYADDLESHLGPSGQAVHSLEFYDTRPEHDFVRGAKFHAVPVPGPLSAIEMRRERPFDELWGPAVHEVAETHSRTFAWAANTEDLPEEHNRVTLSPDLVDGDGLPAPKVTYRISDNSQRLLDFSLARMRELHEASGAVEMLSFGLIPDQPGHLLGTARMGADPRTSVVNSFGQAHDVDNLFIADGSIFVTSGSVNPTGTIHALALRVAQGIAEYAEDGQVSS